MDHREDAVELADSIVSALITKLARGKHVTNRDGTKRPMTPREFQESAPAFCDLLYQEARRKATFKLGQYTRESEALREENARLRRLLLPHQMGERETPITGVDPMFDIERTPTVSFPDGVLRQSQRPTPVTR